MGTRHSNTYGSEFSYEGHLIIDAQGGMKLSRGEPRLSPGERAIKLTVKVPRAIFKTPTLTAAITVPNDLAPPEISVETLGQIENALKVGTGLKFSVTIGESENPPRG